MKVLLVSDYAVPFGGTETMLLKLRELLRERGHEVRVFASSARPGVGASFADYPCFGTTSRFRTLLQTANPWAFYRLRRVLAEFKPDIVHVMMFLTQLSPLILPLLKKRTSLHHAQWYRTVCPLGTKLLPNGDACRVPAGLACYRHHCLPIRDWLPLMLQMYLWRRWRSTFDVVLASSHAIERHLAGAAINPVEVIFNGVSPKPPQVGLSETPTALFAGRLVREKGVDILLQAFARVAQEIPQVSLLIVGEGPERRQLEQMVDTLQLSERVSFAGYLAPDTLERAGSGTWVQVVPSRWAEPFGLVAAEAMMRGMAVIASDSGGLSEIVQHERTGFLVPPADADALAEKLLALLRNRALAEAMGRAGRQLALEQFSEAGFIDAILTVYQRLSVAQTNQ